MMPRETDVPCPVSIRRRHADSLASASLTKAGRRGPASDVERDQLEVVGDARHPRIVDSVGVVAGPMVINMQPREREQDRNAFAVK